MKNKKIVMVSMRILVGILVLILLVSLPIVGVRVSDNFELISSKFVGVKSKYQGIIEIWNIDTFESGTNPKSKYISKIAESFQKQNKGLYVLVRDLSEYECINLLKKGEKPDIFSCSYGVASAIKDYVQPFLEVNFDIDKNLMEAGKFDDKQYAIAWCMGFYALISTEENLLKAKQNLDEGIILSQKALKMGYDVKNKKYTKIISSLTYGVNDYLLPKKAFSTYTNMGLVITSEYSLDKNVNLQTTYTAYTKILSGESVVLLGTQRDVYRINNRELSGKTAKAYYEVLSGFSDLIQFCLLTKNEDSIKLKLCENFVQYLVLENNQQKLTEIGMMPVKLSNKIYNTGIMCDIIPQNFSIDNYNNIFISKAELASLQ